LLYTVSLCHFISHCKWLLSAVCYHYNPEDINKQIIQNDDHNYYHYKHICFCSESGKETNYSIDTLGLVYPEQMLEINVCNICSNEVTVLYAEIYNIGLPISACKIAHHS